MLVTCAAVLLENGYRVGGPGDVCGSIDHAHNLQPECKPTLQGREANEKSLDKRQRQRPHAELAGADLGPRC